MKINTANIDNKILMNISIIVIMLLLILSKLLQINLVIILTSLILGALILFYSYIDEERLLGISLIFTILAPWLSNYVSIIGYLPQVYLLLMILKLLQRKFIKRKKIILDKLSVFLLFITLFIGIISLLYERNYSNTNLIFLFYIILKRSAILIVYIYTLNINLKRVSIVKFINYVGILLIIQLPIIIMQFLMGVDRDSITGLMGNNATGYAIQFLALYFILYSQYKGLKKSFIYFYFISVLMYCAIAEVKVGFFCIPILMLLNIKDTKKYVSKISFIILSLLGLIIAYNLLVKFNPNHDFLQKGFIKNYLSKSYAIQQETINRSGYMPILKEYVLINDKELLIGKGIGATHSHNSIDIFRGAVDKSFGFLEISIFSIPALLVELGIIGFLIYLLFFIRLSFIFIRDYKKTKEAQPLMIIFITMLFMWYNNSILNSFYIIFFTGVLLSINYKRYLERNNKCYHL